MPWESPSVLCSHRSDGSLLAEAVLQLRRFSAWMKRECSLPFRRRAHLLTCRSSLGVFSPTVS